MKKISIWGCLILTIILLTACGEKKLHGKYVGFSHTLDFNGNKVKNYTLLSEMTNYKDDDIIEVGTYKILDDNTIRIVYENGKVDEVTFKYVPEKDEITFFDDIDVLKKIDE